MTKIYKKINSTPQVGRIQNQFRDVDWKELERELQYLAVVMPRLKISATI